MSFEITGKLIEKFETKQVSDKFRKREFVVEKKAESGGMDFSDYIKFQLTQDRCELLDSFQINDMIRISFNIRGNKWEKNGTVSYFTNLDVWKIEPVEERESPEAPPIPGPEEIPPEEDPGIDDLPF